MDEKRYEEVGTNYRFFLGWRHAAFAGDLVIIFAVLSQTLSVYKDQPSLAWLVPAIGSPVGILLWVIDSRTRALYHAAIRAGKKIEGKKGGFYSQLSRVALKRKSSPFSVLTQSAALNVLFIGSSMLLFVLSAILYCATHQGQCNIRYFFVP